jgi:hypothetical protein
MSQKTEQPDELVITLKKPVEFKGQSYDQLVLREPTAGEWREILKKPEDDQRTFCVALVSGVPEGAVLQIGIGQVVEAEEFIVGFYRAARKTGVS